MTKHNLLKKISLGVASLALICPLALGGISNSTVANARRRPRTHRVYRHHRRARRTRKSRRANHKARRNRRHTRRSHRRVARKYHARRESIHKARRHHTNYNWLDYYENNTPAPVHHESQAQWYKNNALRMYNHNINSSHMFRRGFIVGTGGIDQDGEDILDYNQSGGGNEGEGSIERRYANNPQYKHGWIISNSLGLDYEVDTKDKIKEESKSDYTRSLNRWNAGIDYLKANNQDGLIDYDSVDGQWSRDPVDQFPAANHQQNPFY